MTNAAQNTEDLITQNEQLRKDAAWLETRVTQWANKAAALENRLRNIRDALGD